MAGKTPDITHSGTIQQIDGNKVYVKIQAQSACATCHAKGSCTVADMSDKMIEVFNIAPDKYNLSYRHMSRSELELFFDACDAAVNFENPDRVIKRVEGDYDPPAIELELS